jgi:serine/threonine-protein kinase
VLRLSITLPPETGIVDGGVAVSVDGKRLVYVGIDREIGSRRLYLRELDQPDTRILPGTEGARQPFFSPDGEWVGFISDSPPTGDYARPGWLKKVAVRGGSPVPLVQATALGGSWGEDDTIVFTRTVGSGTVLFRIPASGGTPERLTTPRLEKGEWRHAWPHHIPGIDAIIFSITGQKSFNEGRIAVLFPRTGEYRTVIEQGYHAGFLRSGHLAYVLDGNLMAIPFDPKRLRTAGTAFRAIETIRHEPISGEASFSVSSNGLLVYAAGVTAERRLVWVTRQGVSTPLGLEPAAYAYPRLSPDGRQLAVGVNADIWVIDLERSTRTRIGDRGVSPPPPISFWTPDKRLTFNRRTNSPETTIEWIANGSEPSVVLLTRPHLIAGPSWAGNGKLMAFWQFSTPTSRDLWVLNLADGAPPHPFLVTPANERGPRFSPDGRWIAYVSNAFGQDEVFLKPYPGPGEQVAVSAGRGTEPTWSLDGRELFYRVGNRMVAVTVVTSPTLSLGQPRVLFEGPYLQDPAFAPQYDVALDGQRFIMIASSQSTNGGLAVVQNWFSELQQRVP